MSQRHGIEDGTTDEAFQALQEQCFLWERGAPVGTFKNFYIHLYDTVKERERNKQESILGLL